MTPFRSAALEHADGHGAVLALDAGWRARVALVAPGVGRVLLLPPAGLREPHTWAVIDGQPRDPWRGADRSALFPAAPEATLTRDPAGLTLADDQLRVHIATDPFVLTWEQWDGSTWQRCCTDRPTFGYGSAQRSGLTGHWQRRDEHDQYFGLGDKTGPLNKAGRRFRTRALDALGYNGESSDPLYKHWPFFIGRRADTGSCYGVYYDTLAECTFDFGQEFDNYHGFYRATEIADGDLDCYVFAGPDIGAALARFVELIGGTAMPPRWSLGYANTAMALGRRARRAGPHRASSSPPRSGCSSRSRVSTSARATPAAASGATCSPGTATSSPTRSACCRPSAMPACAPWPTSSPACSTITRRSSRWPPRGASSARRAVRSASTRSGTAGAPTSTSLATATAIGGRTTCSGRCSRSASMPAGTTTTSTRSGTRPASRMPAASRCRSIARGHCTRC